MNWIIAFLTGVLGLIGVGLLAAACARWYRVSSFEGAAGYFVVSLALLGGFAGLVFGWVTSWIVTSGGSGGGFLQALGWSWGLAIALIGVATCICWALADVPPKIGGQELMLAVELRLPAGEVPPPASGEDKSTIDLGSVVNHRQRNSRSGELRLSDARLEEGRWVVPGSVFLYTMRGLRSLGIQLGGSPRDGFLIPLPARPGQAFEAWSEWLPRNPPGEQPRPETRMSFRFRVERIVPEPPPPDPEVVEAERFVALAPDAPLAEWLGFMEHDSPEERVAAVMAVVEPRQAELARLIRSADAGMRELALAAVPRLSSFTSEVAEAVQAEAREIAAGIRRFNDMSDGEPRFYDVQIELRGRFNDWKRAWWAMHRSLGLDGRAPVQEIHDLARVRAQGTSMEEIVLNARVILEALPAPSGQGQAADPNGPRRPEGK